MRLLDLFAGGGGGAKGYHLAGFEVVGVDINHQKNFPFTFIQADAMTFPLDGFDVVHASPPCQAYSRMSTCRPGLKEKYPDLVDPIRQRLIDADVPYVIENVPGSPVRPDIKLCGCQFGLRSPQGLGVRRERWFESNMRLEPNRTPHDHREPSLPIYGHSPGRDWTRRYGDRFTTPGIRERAAAMGCDWLNQRELAESIPPAFTEFIGQQLMAQLAEEKAA